MNIAVIFAGGVGTRMNSKEKPKQFLEVYHKPIIIHTLDVFEKHELIDAIVIACKEEWIEYLEGLIKKYHIDKVKKIVPGGETGQKSIYNGLLAAKSVCDEQNEENAVVLIHDGVRPIIDDETITLNIQSVEKNGSAITTGRVTETLLVIDEKSSAIEDVPDRSASRLAKAPQSFFLNDILKYHEKARSEGRFDFIDTCTLMSHYGFKLTLVDGPINNIKVTTPLDFYLMRAMFEAKENEQLL
ncbi:MAG: 2-C-methyl-D-erythritol 4-phosphate cytidylyltransferase [Lachnospiraceae bacterium]|nr:2-C-methyl-D-erythritol 4-phosphate cytidylyltransferase [Lachnospiraceae bacterium]